MQEVEQGLMAKAKKTSVSVVDSSVNDSGQTVESTTLGLSEESIAGYFARHIDDASGVAGVKLGDFTKSYVVNLMSEYSKAAALHPQGEEDTLAMLYLKSQNVNTEERVRLLRRLGDSALCISGFFSDSLNRKVVDVDYYINMGGGAYGTLASIFGRRREAEVFSELYGELAHKFPALVDILSAVSDSNGGQNQTMLRLYDRWLKTGSERLRKMLSSKGIIASPAASTRTIQ